MMHLGVQFLMYWLMFGFMVAGHIFTQYKTEVDYALMMELEDERQLPFVRALAFFVMVLLWPMALKDLQRFK